MSGLYPSLEDMKVDQMAKAQVDHANSSQAPQPGSFGTAPALLGYPGAPGQSQSATSALYPSLEEYMGLPLTREAVELNMPVVAANPQTVAQTTATSGLIAPVSGQCVGLRKAEIQRGLRQLSLCKDTTGKIGLRVRAVDKGVFVALVHVGSPAALGGLRFGDQILSINEEIVAGWSTDKAMQCLIKCPVNNIRIVVRDRPFERTLTLQKDSAGYVGFVFKENRIVSIVKDSSAARNGLLIEHHLLEIDGQNVVGLKDKDIKRIIEDCGRTVTVTIIPSYIYEHIIKSMGSSLIKKVMDHSVPDV